MAGAERHLNRADIEAILPHRKPFLFLESATIVEPGKLAIGKLPDLTHSDFAFLKGHFPGLPVFPGALIMEALAELAGIAASSANIPNTENRIGALAEDHMRYRARIAPDEWGQVQLEARITTLRSRLGKAEVRALKDGKVAADGEITFFMVDKSEWPEA